jgi:hypothetical protein
MGGGCNTCTVALRFVEVDEMRTRCMWVQLGQLLAGEHRYRDLVRQVGGWVRG